MKSSTASTSRPHDPHQPVNPSRVGHRVKCLPNVPLVFLTKSALAPPTLIKFYRHKPLPQKPSLPHHKKCVLTCWTQSSWLLLEIQSGLNTSNNIVSFQVLLVMTFGLGFYFWFMERIEHFLIDSTHCYMYVRSWCECSLISYAVHEPRSQGKIVVSVLVSRHHFQLPSKGAPQINRDEF